MVDLSPASDHLTGVVLVQLMKAKPREHDLTLSYSFLVHQEPNWSERKESCCDVDNSLKMFWEIEKSGTDRDERLVLTEEESKGKDSLKYKNGRYLVAVPWKEINPISLTLNLWYFLAYEAPKEI